MAGDTVIDEIGHRYGLLTVLHRTENKGRYPYWLCKCDCGNYKRVRGSTLRAGKTISCGCRIGSGIDETGNRYDMLVVLKKVKYRGRRWKGWHWLCQCDCGRRIVVIGHQLRSGGTGSCGCRNRLPEGESALNELVKCYERNAATRGIEWRLTKELVRAITQQPCHYCGAVPKNRIAVCRGNGDYIYNGIDRKDPARGYELDNVVPCCRHCNYAKNDSTYEEFLEYLDQLMEYRQRKKHG